MHNGQCTIAIAISKAMSTDKTSATAMAVSSGNSNMNWDISSRQWAISMSTINRSNQQQQWAIATAVAMNKINDNIQETMTVHNQQFQYQSVAVNNISKQWAIAIGNERTTLPRHTRFLPSLAHSATLCVGECDTSPQTSHHAQCALALPRHSRDPSSNSWESLWAPMDS